MNNQENIDRIKSECQKVDRCIKQIIQSIEQVKHSEYLDAYKELLEKEIFKKAQLHMDALSLVIDQSISKKKEANTHG